MIQSRILMAEVLRPLPKSLFIHVPPPGAIERRFETFRRETFLRFVQVKIHTDEGSRSPQLKARAEPPTRDKLAGRLDPGRSGTGGHGGRAVGSRIRDVGSGT